MTLQTKGLSVDSLDKSTYNRDIATKENEMQFFLVSSPDGNVVLQAKDQIDAMQLANEYDFDWDTIVPIEVYFTEETGE